jgi:hypothetical protein
MSSPLKIDHTYCRTGEEKLTVLVNIGRLQDNSATTRVAPRPDSGRPIL